MPEGYYKQVVAELARLGFLYSKNAKGSHEKWRHPATGMIVVVPRNLMSRHTANGILKDAGSSQRF